jgi:hypothetical protein
MSGFALMRKALEEIAAMHGNYAGYAKVVARNALAAAARQGGDVKQAPAESPQSGDAKQRNAQGSQQ